MVPLLDYFPILWMLNALWGLGLSPPWFTTSFSVMFELFALYVSLILQVSFALNRPRLSTTGFNQLPGMLYNILLAKLLILNLPFITRITPHGGNEFINGAEIKPPLFSFLSLPSQLVQ
jgi:hypothetical protein